MMQTTCKIFPLLVMVFGLLSIPHTPAEEPWTNLGLETYIFQMIADDTEGNVYAAAYSTDLSQPIKEGLFRLSPGSTEWTQVYDTYSVYKSIHSVLEPVPGTLLISTTEGVYRSTDGGDTLTTTSLNTNRIRSLAIGPSGAVHAASYGGYHVSSDLGETWAFHPVPVSGQMDEVIFDGPDRMFLRNSDIIYRSEDHGATWRIIYTVAFLDYSLGHMEASHDGTLYFLRQYNDSSGGWNLLRSTDHGDNWQTILQFSSFPPDYSGVRSFTVSPDGELFILYSGQRAIIRSVDQGQTWTPDFEDAPFFNDPENHICSLYISPRGTLYISSLAGVHRYGLKVPVEISEFFIE